jgi:DNA-binding response OmpR family regulator
VRLLVVEDEPVLARNLADGLRDAGFAVDVALDGDTALEKLDEAHYDVVLLDRDLPGTHGDDVCRVITAQSARPHVLMLTAATGIDERVQGLELGADDYLPKPFAFAELVARVRALSRRNPATPPTLSSQDLVKEVAVKAAVRGRDLRTDARPAPRTSSRSPG